MFMSLIHLFSLSLPPLSVGPSANQKKNYRPISA